ncbi:MAG: glycosyltransferase family 4 protein [Chloroflexi bacterium]|nr:glycosyltransferase family 4 protein [Chloroflexota bacterium]
MEKVAYELVHHLSRQTEIKLISWGGSNKWLPLVLPCFLVRSVLALVTGKVRVIYLADGLLAPLGCLLRAFRKPVVITIHGLDITHHSRLYQHLVPRCVGKMDRVICVSQATRQACLARGVPDAKITVIQNGISDLLYVNRDRRQLRQEMSFKLNLGLDGRKTLLFVGRLVERKGIRWFIENVVPRLERSGCVLLIAGSGPLSPRLRSAIHAKGLSQTVIMLGRVDEATLGLLYNACDLFVMPNIPVAGDMEGFGLVAVEAASCGLPVVAANLEGIADAVQDGRNGFLVEPGDAAGFADVIKKLLADGGLRQSFGARARRFTLETYGWERAAGRYLESFQCLR